MPDKFDIFELVETKEAVEGYYQRGELFRVLIPEGDDTIGRKGYAICVRMKNLREAGAKESLEIPLSDLRELTHDTVAKYLQDTKAPLLLEMKKAERSIKLIEEYSHFLCMGREERVKKSIQAIKDCLND